MARRSFSAFVDEPWRQSTYRDAILKAEGSMQELRSCRIDAHEDEISQSTAETFISYFEQVEKIIENLLDCIGIQVDTQVDCHGQHSHHLNVLNELRNSRNPFNHLIGQGDEIKFLNWARLFRNQWKRYLHHEVVKRDFKLVAFCRGSEPECLEEALKYAIQCVKDSAGQWPSLSAIFEDWHQKEEPSHVLEKRLLFREKLAEREHEGIQAEMRDESQLLTAQKDHLNSEIANLKRSLQKCQADHVETVRANKENHRSWSRLLQGYRKSFDRPSIQANIQAFLEDSFEKREGADIDWLTLLTQINLLCTDADQADSLKKIAEAKRDHVLQELEDAEIDRDHALRLRDDAVRRGHSARAEVSSLKAQRQEMHQPRQPMPQPQVNKSRYPAQNGEPQDVGPQHHINQQPAFRLPRETTPPQRNYDRRTTVPPPPRETRKAQHNNNTQQMAQDTFTVPQYQSGQSQYTNNNNHQQMPQQTFSVSQYQNRRPQ